MKDLKLAQRRTLMDVCKLAGAPELIEALLTSGDTAWGDGSLLGAGHVDLRGSI